MATLKLATTSGTLVFNGQTIAGVGANPPQITLVDEFDYSVWGVRNTVGTVPIVHVDAIVPDGTSICFTTSGALGLCPIASATNLSLSGYLSPAQSTVSALPTCNSSAKGQKYIVTDAMTPTFHATLTGGGSTVVGALCSGSNWVAD